MGCSIQRTFLNRSSEPNYMPVIDLVRTFSILVVMAGHFKGFPSPSWGFELWDQLQNNNAYGVTIFFVVSGFMITRILDKQPGGLFHPSYRTFYIRRTARILPLFLAMVVVGLFFTFAVPGHGM